MTGTPEAVTREGGPNEGRLLAWRSRQLSTTSTSIWPIRTGIATRRSPCAWPGAVGERGALVARLLAYCLEYADGIASRLHRASKSADRVVYTHKDPSQWLRQVSGDRIHRTRDIEIFSFDRTSVASRVERLARRTAMTVSVADRHVRVALDGVGVQGALTRHALA